MFDLGFQELIVIFVVALLVMGPKKLPELGRTFGKVVREFKKAFYDFKSEMDVEIKDVKTPMENAINPIRDLHQLTKSPISLDKLVALDKPATTEGTEKPAATQTPAPPAPPLPPAEHS